MSKTSRHAIAAAVPLTLHPKRPADPITACNLCGAPSDSLSVWREYDVRDRPILGLGALVFMDRSHEACARDLDEHPRLYVEEMGAPGHFPLLCGPCTFRYRFECSHPKLRANGGAGLRVELHGLPVIVCRRPGGCSVPLRVACTCEGMTPRGETTETTD